MVGLFPAFLLGPLAVLVRDDLGISRATFGLAMVGFFGGQALLAAGGGHTAQRWGARRSMVVAAAGAATSLALVAVAGAWWGLLLGLMVGGAANALQHPATTMALTIGIPGRTGWVLGLKHAAAPMGMLIGGLAVPVVMRQIGWRPVLVCGAALALAISWRSHRLPTPTRAVVPVADAAPDADSWSGTGTPMSVRRDVTVIVAAGCASAAITTSITNLTGSTVDHAGLSVTHAGLVAALAAGSAVVTMLMFARRSEVLSGDRGRVHRIISAALVAAGSGHLMLASGRAALVVPAAVLVHAAGSGWNSLLHHTVIRYGSASAAVMTGRLMVGYAGGSAAGPPVLGAVADRMSYASMWGASGALAMTGAVLLTVAAPPRRR